MTARSWMALIVLGMICSGVPAPGAETKLTREEIRKRDAEIRAARLEARTEARAKAEADAKARAEAKAEARARAEAEAKAKAEERMKEQAADRARLEAEWASQVNWGPYFIGYESEPSMDVGGRLVTTAHRGICDVGERFTRRFPYVRFPYEMLFAIGLSTVQHEMFGHGARGREYNLNPSYGFGLDFSGYTEVDKEPRDNEQLANLCSGGTEGDGIMARRILLDFCQPGGAPSSATMLMFFGKVDLSIYVYSTSKPEPGHAVGNNSTFTDEYESGNDIAIYLATRQAQRLGGLPIDVWNRDYEIDFDERLLQTTYDQARDVALWNLVDPMMWASMVFYVKDHLIQGRRSAQAPAIPLGGNFGLTVGTRGALGPDAVSRFLDLYLLSPVGVFSLYGRDIRAAEDTTHGFGAGLYRLAAGSAVKLSACADFWTNPEAPEEFYTDDAGWNVNGEVEVRVAEPVSLWIKAGNKSEGFFPGTPSDSGLYAGGGVVVQF